MLRPPLARPMIAALAPRGDELRHDPMMAVLAGKLTAGPRAGRGQIDVEPAGAEPAAIHTCVRAPFGSLKGVPIQSRLTILIGGNRNSLPGELAGGFYMQPTVFKGHNKIGIFQEEIFGPVVSVTTFKTDEETLAIANDTL